MSLLATGPELKKAAQHLAAHDSLLAPVIARAGLPDLQPHTDYYQELVDSIISQQLSVYAARAIEDRFRALFDGHFPAAEEILKIDVETLRGIGFSQAKAVYVLDLAQHIVDGRIKFDHLDKLGNDDIIKELSAVKGIGEWTAHMFLIFCMGRLDVLAYGDLGIRNGIYKLYGLKAVPTADKIVKVAKKYHWHPYESVACWYVWHSLDNKPAV